MEEKLLPRVHSTAQSSPLHHQGPVLDLSGYPPLFLPIHESSTTLLSPELTLGSCQSTTKPLSQPSGPSKVSRVSSVNTTWLKLVFKFQPFLCFFFFANFHWWETATVFFNHSHRIYNSSPRTFGSPAASKIHLLNLRGFLELFHYLSNYWF